MWLLQVEKRDVISTIVVKISSEVTLRTKSGENLTILIEHNLSKKDIVFNPLNDLDLNGNIKKSYLKSIFHIPNDCFF